MENTMVVYEETVEVSIIIPVYRDWAKLGKCLFALSNQTISTEKFEIIVINNDPEDIPPDNIIFPLNSVIYEEKREGSYAARNTGIRYSRGNIYAFTDADCIPASNWLEKGIRKLKKESENYRIGGKIELYKDNGSSELVYNYEKIFSFPQKDYVFKQGMAATANMFICKHVFDKVGLFNEKLYSGGDSEWGKRAKNLGYSIDYCEEAIVLHPSRKSIKELKYKAKRVAGGHNIIARHGFIKMHYYALLTCLPPIRSIYMCMRSNYSLGEKLSAISVRYYLRIIKGIEIMRIAYGATPRR